MAIEIYSKGGTLRTSIAPSSSDTCSRSLMGDTILSLSFDLYEFIPLEMGDYVDFLGSRYRLLEDYTPEMISTISYKYALRFYGAESELRNAIVLKPSKLDASTTFAYFATAEEHLQLIADNINRTRKTADWVVGTVIATGSENIDYTNRSCFDALSLIADTFKTEWWIEGTTINLVRCEHSEPLQLGYASGLVSISRSESNVRPCTRLYPLGSTRNIDATKYGKARLGMPQGKAYLEKNTHLGIIEAVEETAFSHIYPRYNGRVSSVRTEERKGTDGKVYTIFYFKDDALAFVPNDHEIAGLVKHVVFQSGELNGRDFEANYHPERREWEIITQFPYEGIQLPGAPLIPKVGDEYIPYNFRMPIEYVTRAEQELEQAVKHALEDRSKDTAIYRLSTDYVEMMRRGTIYKLGARVILSDNRLFAETSGKHATRIVSISQKVANPYEATLECSHVVEKGRIASIESGITALSASFRETRATLPAILRSWDSTDPSEQNIMSSTRTLNAIRDLALRKDRDDRTAYSLGSKEHVPGVVGWLLSPEGDLDLRNLKVSGTLEVDELRKNRISIQEGEHYFSSGNAVVESVSGDSFVVKGDEGDSSSLVPGDYVIGKWATTSGQVEVCKLKVTSVSGLRVNFSLAPVTSVRPRAGMHLAQMGHDTNQKRQRATIVRGNAIIQYQGVKGWEVKPEHITAVMGDLEDFSLEPFGALRGSGVFINNAYITGRLEQKSSDGKSSRVLPFDKGYWTAETIAHPGDRFIYQGRRWTYRGISATNSKPSVANGWEDEGEWGEQKTVAKIDATALDHSKFYPVTIGVPSNPHGRLTFTLERDLMKGGQAPSYSRHTGVFGVSLYLEWSVNLSDWGVIDVDRRIHRYAMSWNKEGESVVGSIMQLHEVSMEVVYVRGGGIYTLSAIGRSDLEIMLRPTDYHLFLQGSYDRIISTLDNVEVPIPDIDIAKQYTDIKIEEARQDITATSEELAKAKSELANARKVADDAKRRAEDTYTKAQADGKVSEAERKAIAEANEAEQNAIRHADSKAKELSDRIEGNYTSIMASVTTIEGTLQRQIDKQVEAFWGTTPPTSRMGWEPKDDAKHEGDTYTCRQPDGVTITPENAHLYPHVGKSWRWHDGGWLEIADTDVTRALALAGQAKATADGKVTHFIGDVLPVGYKRGDLWTLTSPWNGYPKGEVLTATIDEAVGQVNFNHWAKAVRYTDDSAVEALQIGSRNYIRKSYFGKLQDAELFDVHLTETLPAGVYTLTLDVDIQRSSGFISVLQANNGNYARFAQNPKAFVSISASTSGVHSLTFEVDSEFNNLYIYPQKTWMARGEGGLHLYKKLKLEKGHKFSDFSLSPEDVEVEREIATFIANHASTMATHKAVIEEAKILLENPRLAGKDIANYLSNDKTQLENKYNALNSVIENNETAPLNLNHARNLYKGWSANLSNLRNNLAKCHNEISRQLAEETSNALAESKRYAYSKVQELKVSIDNVAQKALDNDGKIDDVEAKMIAESVLSFRKAFDLEVNRLRATYEATHGDVNLVDKYPLSKAYSDYLASKDELGQVMEDISKDSKVTAEELKIFNEKYRSFRSLTDTLEVAICNARKVIELRKKELSEKYAQDKAKQAEGNAKDHANRTASEAERRAKEHADAKVAGLDIDYLKEAVAKGTKVEGGKVSTGVVLTEVLGMKDSEGLVRSYMSGDSKYPAFASGVTNFATPEEKRKIEIFHDGRARLGQIHLNRIDGAIDFIDKKDSYLTIGGTPKSLDDILFGSFGTIDRRGDEVNRRLEEDGEDEHQITERFVIPKAGYTISIQGEFTASATAQLRPPGPVLNSTETAKTIAVFEIKLQRLEGSDYKDVQTWTASSVSWLEMRYGVPSTISQDGAVKREIDTTIGGVDAGTYRLVAHIKQITEGGTGRTTFTSSALSVSAYITDSDVHISRQAMYAQFGAKRVFYIDGDTLAIRHQNVDMPGVLATGRVNALGYIEFAWGPRANMRGYTTPSTLRIDNSVYKIYHSVGHERYSVQLTPFNTRDTGSILELTPYYFTCKFNGTMDDKNYAHRFCYTIMGDND